MNSYSVQFAGAAAVESVVLEISVGEGEFGFLSLAPPCLVVEIYISALLELLCDFLRLLMPLEPRKVLLVVPPRPRLQLGCSQVLLVGA